MRGRLDSADIILPKFLTPLRVELLDDIPALGHNARWMLLEDLVYDSAILRARVTAQRGFVTDFGSIPKWLPIAYTHLHDRTRRPAVIHDLAYQTHLTKDRDEADAVLREACEAIGLQPPDPETMWMGVRLGGGSAWDSGPNRYTVLNPKAPGGSA